MSLLNSIQRILSFFFGWPRPRVHTFLEFHTSLCQKFFKFLIRTRLLVTNIIFLARFLKSILKVIFRYLQTGNSHIKGEFTIQPWYSHKKLPQSNNYKNVQVY